MESRGDICVAQLSGARLNKTEKGGVLECELKRDHIMKKLIAIATALLVGGVFAPQAEARPQAVGNYSIINAGHHSCGCAIQTKRYVVGYDRYRRPIYRYVTVPTVHRCRTHSRVHSSHYRGHSNWNHNQRYYGNRGGHVRASYSYSRPSYGRSYYQSSRNSRYCR